MKQSEISTEADKIINTVFVALKTTDNKEAWKKALDMASVKIQDCVVRAGKLAMENEDSEESTKMYAKKEIWSRVHFKLLNAFGKKFVKKQ